MMKSIKLVTLLFFILGFISCEKEIEVPIENNDIPLLTKEIYSDALYFEYTYNDANLLYEEKTKTSYTRYNYNEYNQLLSYDMYLDSRVFSSNMATADSATNRVDWVNPENTRIWGWGTYSYSNEKLNKIIVTYPSGSENYTTFDYDSNGRIGKKTFYTNNLPSGFIEFIYDDKGNLILENRYDLVNGDAILGITTAYEFDDKQNPFKAFKRLLLPGRNTNENNIIKETRTLFYDVPGIDTDNVQVTGSTYEYNSKGYPVKKNNMILYEYR